MTVISFKGAVEKSCFTMLDEIGRTLGRKIFEYTIMNQPTIEELDALIQAEVSQFKGFLTEGGINEQDIETACLRVKGRILNEGLDLLNTLPDDEGTLQ